MKDRDMTPPSDEWRNQDPMEGYAEARANDDQYYTHVERTITKLYAADRTCRVCKAAIEDERHAMLTELTDGTRFIHHANEACRKGSLEIIMDRWMTHRAKPVAA